MKLLTMLIWHADISKVFKFLDAEDRVVVMWRCFNEATDLSPKFSTYGIFTSTVSPWEQFSAKQDREAPEIDNAGSREETNVTEH